MALYTHTHTHTLHLKNRERGITLIALVITIIVLLILAGVSIAMLTGTNGILTQAQKAKERNNSSATEEKLKLIATTTKMQAETGTLDADKLVEEITRSYGGQATKSKSGFPITAEIGGNKFEINNDGNIAVNKKIKEITGNEEINTITQDSLGNRIVVPAGFGVVNPDDNVTDGIIVKDKTHTNTAGSEFVWIPVGAVTKEDKTTVNIELKRYVFNEDGTINEKFTKTEPEEQVKQTGYSYCYTEGLKNSVTINTHAKNIADFRTKAESSNGYYIGRYEARDKDTTSDRTESSSDTNQVVCMENNYVYNQITQPQAATLSREMYTGTAFESDLINSYAWDTATLFLQTFDNRVNKDTLKVYSRQTSLNSSLADQGTNKLETNQQDKICNVYDMASNCYEWSTETYGDIDSSCSLRGGLYYGDYYYESARNYYFITHKDFYTSFRPILYL